MFEDDVVLAERDPSFETTLRMVEPPSRTKSGVRSNKSHASDKLPEPSRFVIRPADGRTDASRQEITSWVDSICTRVFEVFSVAGRYEDLLVSVFSADDDPCGFTFDVVVYGDDESVDHFRSLTIAEPHAGAPRCQAAACRLVLDGDTLHAELQRVLPRPPSKPLTEAQKRVFQVLIASCLEWTARMKGVPIGDCVLRIEGFTDLELQFWKSLGFAVQSSHSLRHILEDFQLGASTAVADAFFDTQAVQNHGDHVHTHQHGEDCSVCASRDKNTSVDPFASLRPFLKLDAETNKYPLLNESVWTAEYRDVNRSRFPNILYPSIVKFSN
eukprot:ANDGO_07119.mRNA.1 hypothetical protein